MSEAIATRYVDEFRAAFMAGVEGFRKAGEVYVKAIDEDAGNGKLFRDAFPGIEERSWVGFERVGRGEVLPQLQLVASPLCRLPVSQQKAYADKPIPVLLDGGDVLDVHHYNLTPDQKRQALASDHVRSLNEQKAWLETEKKLRAQRAVKPPAMVEPYRVYRGKLEVMEPCTLNRKTLARLLSEME